MAEFALSFAFVVFIFIVPMLAAVGLFLILFFASMASTAVAGKVEVPSARPMKHASSVSADPLFVGRNGLSVVRYVVSRECRN